VPGSGQAQHRTDKMRVLLIGRLDHQKGFHTVLEAIARTGQTHAYEVHLCGQGSEEDSLRAPAARLSVPLLVRGHVGTADVAG
jgi:glycogen synthase